MSRIVRIKLGDEDAKTYRALDDDGNAKWLELDLDRNPVRESIDLDEAGIDWRRVSEGEPVFVDGKPKTDDNGQAIRKRNWPVIHLVLVWKALRRNGLPVPLADLDFDERQAAVLWPPVEPAESPGKDQPEPRKPSRRSSRSSGTSSRG